MGTQSHFDHIQISTKVTTEKRNLGTKMALMKIMQTAIIGLCLVTLLGAFPQISLETTTLGPLEENCHYEDQNITEIVQEEKLEKKCICGEESVSKCLKYTTIDSQCVDYKEEVCEDIPIAACTPTTITTNVSYTTDVCTPKAVEKCKYHWEDQEAGNGVIVKVWVKILSSCNTTYVDMCETVTKYRTREVR